MNLPISDTGSNTRPETHDRRLRDKASLTVDKLVGTLVTAVILSVSLWVGTTVNSVSRDQTEIKITISHIEKMQTAYVQDMALVKAQISALEVRWSSLGGPSDPNNARMSKIEDNNQKIAIIENRVSSLERNMSNKGGKE